MAYAIKNSPNPDGARYFNDFEFTQVKNAYDTGWQVLQPFRRNMSSPWEFRWIALPKTPVVNCPP